MVDDSYTMLDDGPVLVISDGSCKFIRLDWLVLVMLNSWTMVLHQGEVVNNRRHFHPTAASVQLGHQVLVAQLPFTRLATAIHHLS